jgi:two-component system CheB/CheR fusion protein
VNDQPDANRLTELLEFIRDSRGFDFTGYKRTSLARRISKRMQDAGAQSYSDYHDLLEANVDEYTDLFNTILINVTGFFRDPEAWDYMRSEIVPGIVAGGEEIRIWSAGCSSGEEAYSLAMMFAEALGVDAFLDRVKIYATDVDDMALGEARRAVYTRRSLETIGTDLRERYFEPSGGGFVFRADLRRRVIFGRLDIMSDAPISRLDLLACRNTLMYFNASTQAQILNRLHFALRDNGVLFLGKAEMLMTNGSRFVPVNIAHRFFQCRPGSHMVDPGPNPAEVARNLSGEALRHRQLRDLAFETGPWAKILVDGAGTVVQINRQARVMFGLSPRDEGRPLRDLEVSYRPAELRSLIEQAYSSGRPVRLNAVERSLGPDDLQYLDLQVQSMIAQDGEPVGAVVIFTDATTFVRLQHEVNAARQELESAYEELQSTNEELETTNEELQSSNEELETTNEELQSTNEELETTNEELQSTNEELETMNDELRTRSGELDQAATFLSGVLASVPAGVVVLDSDLRIRSWNRVSQDLWGLRSDEVLGESFFSLDLGLPTGPLRDPVRLCLDGSSEERVHDLPAVNRRGQPIVCEVTCTRLADSGAGVVVLVEPHRE